VAALDERFVKGAEQICRRFLLPNEDAREVEAMTRLILAISDGVATHRILTGDDKLARRALAVGARAVTVRDRTPGAVTLNG
jgi:hypothetical protein